MKFATLVDLVAVETAKVEAVFQALPWPQSNSQEEEQLSNMLSVLSDQIARLKIAVNELAAAASKDQVA